MKSIKFVTLRNIFQNTVNSVLVKMFLKLVFALVSVVICFATDLPSFVKKCRYGDVQCIANSATLLGNHATELNQLGFTQFDPLRLDKFTWDEIRDTTVDMKLTLTNNSLYGFSQITVGEAIGWTKDAATSKFELYGNIPELNYTGNYNVDGRIISMPIQGDGEYTMTINDVSFQIKFKPFVEIKNGKQYLRISKLEIYIKPTKFYAKVKNLFNGDEELGNSVNQAINNRWRDIWDEVASVLSDFHEAFALGIVQQFFNQFAYEDIFLPEK